MKGVKLRQEEGVVVVSFQDRKLTDDEQIQLISDDLSRVLESTPAGMRLLLDFQNVEVVVSMMLGDLVALHKTSLRNGVILQLCGLSSDVLRVINTCKLDQIFNILEAPPSE